MAGEIDSKLPAWRAGGPDALTRAGELLALRTFHGALFGTAYNTSYLIVVGEAPPLGQRRSLRGQPAAAAARRCRGAC